MEMRRGLNVPRRAVDAGGSHFLGRHGVGKLGGGFGLLCRRTRAVRFLAHRDRAVRTRLTSEMVPRGRGMGRGNAICSDEG
jgi:hypothetical protein